MCRLTYWSCSAAVAPAPTLAAAPNCSCIIFHRTVLRARPLRMFIVSMLSDVSLHAKTNLNIADACQHVFLCHRLLP